MNQKNRRNSYVYDINGFNICEGDIVSYVKDYDKDDWPDDREAATYLAQSVVNYSKGSFVIGDPRDCDFLHLYVSDGELWESQYHTIIGNIHDDPELIAKCI